MSQWLLGALQAKALGHRAGPHPRSDRIEQAIQQIQRGLGDPDSPERHRLFRQLRSELELHAAVEDLHVYRVFQQSEPTSDETHAP